MTSERLTAKEIMAEQLYRLTLHDHQLLDARFQWNELSGMHRMRFHNQAKIITAALAKHGQIIVEIDLSGQKENEIPASIPS